MGEKQGIVDRDPFDGKLAYQPYCYCRECRRNRKDRLLSRLFSKWRRRQGKKICKIETE